MLRRALLSAAALYLTTVTLPADGAQFTVADDHITLQGEIVAGDAQQFRTLIAQAQPARLDLDSPGGLVREAMQIADLVAEHYIATFVGPDTVCVSACSVIFFAGSRHVAGDRQVGVHWALEANGSDAMDASIMIAQRLAAYCVAPATIRKLLGTAPQQITWLDATDIATPAPPTPRVPQPGDILIDRCTGSRIGTAMGHIATRGDGDAFCSLHTDQGADSWASANRTIVVAATAVTPPAKPAAAVLPDAKAAETSYRRGVADRTRYERWLAGLSAGTYRDGALWWEAHRSVSGIKCRGNMPAGDAFVGCIAARYLLDPTDALRLSDPDYRRGWNAYVRPDKG
jgi:hypothetical protein